MPTSYSFFVLMLKSRSSAHIAHGRRTHWAGTDPKTSIRPKAASTVYYMFTPRVCGQHVPRKVCSRMARPYRVLALGSSRNVSITEWRDTLGHSADG